MTTQNHHLPQKMPLMLKDDQADASSTSKFNDTDQENFNPNY